ncbi:hypothetical protein [Streptomyces sp. RKAG337]|uniref:hypothetical protein n=1 Tax=Streptomyces sp. RKAG337 TaxID=2893404 RepID=UPI002034145B|nr:hypothetical protein [Streptomyces sp. RKAG337]MCM2428166.1 hypothetical protein [Streptomyces sp. RKAG337]
MVRKQSSGLSTAQEKALEVAQRQAATTGKAVGVDALTSETDTVSANPSGTVTWTTSAQPERVRKNKGWVPVDSRLTRNTDGSFSPSAASGSLSFSGGGTGPLATMQNGAAELALSWPTALPAPTTSGSEITYAGVLPGVDLRLTADTRGGFTEVLIVKNATAAADPRLASVKLTTRTKGVTVGDDGHDNLQAIAPDGQVLFSAPQPQMWDSSGSGAGGPKGAAPNSADPAPGSEASSSRGPGRGAQVARIGAKVSGASIALTPDRTLLTGATTRYPLFIDPSWNPHPASGSRQHFVEVQSGCPTAKNYDSTKYGNPGAGNNTWSGCVGLERSYFQVAIPSSVWRTHIVSATMNVLEASSSSCSASANVALVSSNAFNANTTWNSKPAGISTLGSHSWGPACSSQPSYGYPITASIAKAAAASQGSWTFALVGDESSGTYFKRFSPNPSLSITYNHVPNVPGALSANVGSMALGCATGTPYPVVGKTVATTPPMLTSTVSDADRDALAATYTYWVNGATTKATATSATVASGQKAPVQLPAAFIAGLKDGSTVDWQVTTTDGRDTTGNGSLCHFTVDQRQPDVPTVKSVNGLYPEHSQGATAGTEGSFTLSVTPGPSNNTAAKFVFALDAQPATSNPPAQQVVGAVSNTAVVKVTPPAPGTHILWAYAVDAAGNASAMYAYEFIALGHAPRAFASLQAAFNNTAVSNDATPGAANADGSGQSLSAQDLQAVGWTPGGRITVDGATFTLPSFGSGSPDNVMAANQTIQMNGAGGQALVFLATATNGYTAADRDPADHTSPVIADGSPIAGTNCAQGGGLPADCTAPTGSITYSGSSTPSPYYLSAPDWKFGSGLLASATLPHLNSPGGQTNGPVRIYAFAVPLRPGATIDSVSLPDVSDAPNGRISGLHIFGMAVRDTATAPNGAAWTGAWSSPTEGSFHYASSNFKDMTFRVAATPSVSGSGLRVRLSNALGFTPLTIDHTTLAGQSSGAVPNGVPGDLTFNGGSHSVTIPVGGEVYSDPVTAAVTAGKNVMVSFHLANEVVYLPEHAWASSGYMYVSAVGAGDHTADTTNTAFTGTGTMWGYWTDVLTGIDVTTAGNQPTVAVTGDGLVDPNFTGTTAVHAGTKRLSGALATALRTNTQGVPAFGVVASGMETSQVAVDYGPGVDPALLSRLDRDILSLPGIKTVVVNSGLEDILVGTDDTTLLTAYQTLREQLKAWGIKTVFTTLTPCRGYARCTDAVDANRLDTNSWISEQMEITAPYVDNVDAESAVAVPDGTSTLDPPALKLGAGAAPADYDSGDHVNLTEDGCQAVASAFDLNVLRPDWYPGAS